MRLAPAGRWYAVSRLQRNSGKAWGQFRPSGYHRGFGSSKRAWGLRIHCSCTTTTTTTTATTTTTTTTTTSSPLRSPSRIPLRSPISRHHPSCLVGVLLRTFFGDRLPSLVGGVSSSDPEKKFTFWGLGRGV